MGTGETLLVLVLETLRYFFRVVEAAVVIKAVCNWVKGSLGLDLSLFMFFGVKFFLTAFPV